MRWRTIPKDKVKDRIGDAAVMLFLLLVFLATGCDAPGHGERAQDSDPVVTQTPPVKPATFESFASTEAAEIAPEPVLPEHVTYEEAEAVFREGRYDEAADYFSVYLEERPENVWGHYMRALSLREAGRLDESIDAFERALDLDPTHVKSLINLARVLLAADRTDDALARIEEALAVDPGSPDGFRLLGLARWAKGWYDEAEDAFYQALTLDDRDVWSMNNLGVLRLERGSIDRALPPLARAVELRPDEAVFQNNLGMVLERNGYFEDAVTAYRAAVDADPTHLKARQNLERLGERANRAGLPPLDLIGLADAFVRDLSGDVEEILDVPPDSVRVEVDSLSRDSVDASMASDSVTTDTVPHTPPDSIPDATRQ